MPHRSNEPAAALEPGARVRICDDTLRAFYGEHGTVLRIGTCPRSGAITRVEVWMDDLPASEGPASFYPHEVQPSNDRLGTAI